MKSFLLGFIFFAIIVSVPNNSRCQDVQLMKIEDLMSVISNNQDSLLIINFWATWCKPCVKELPCFYEAHRQFATNGIRVLLVSLDFKRQLESVLKPFLIKQGKGPETWLLDEPDYDAWINKVDPSWTGAIPATLFIKNSGGVKLFHEGEFTCSTLNDTIQQILNK